MTHEEEVQIQLESDRAWHKKMQEEDIASQQPVSEQKPMGWFVFLFSLFLSLVADLCEISIVAAPLVLLIDAVLGLILGFSAGARKQWKKWIAGFLPIPLVRVALLIWAFISSRSKKLQTISGIASKIAPRL